MKDPAVLFYTGDFLNGCTDLTLEERGQYITLLCLQHQKGHLSDKTIRLSVGSINGDVMQKFIKDESGLFYNERMEEEINKRQHFLDTRYFNGKKGGRPTKPNSKPNNKAKHNLPENENINENINKGRSEKEEKKKYSEFVFMLESEYQKLIDEHGDSLTKKFIEKLNNYIGSSGKKYKSDYLAILNWVVKEVTNEVKPQSGLNPKMSTKYLRDEPVR